MNSFFAFLAKLLPTNNVVALVGLITTFAEKLADAEAKQRKLAMAHALDADVSIALRDEANAIADKAGRLSIKLADLVG